MKRYQKTAVIIFLLCLISCNVLNGTSALAASRKDYGVFVGVGPEHMSVMKNYKTIVIDAAYYSKKQISSLKKSGKTVYSYLNIGSIETFRNYYKKFKHCTLGKYENWDEERWIDVSRPQWQNYLTNKLAKELVAKGVDGLFLDNADVYYVYKTNKIYSGLFKILRSLCRYRKPLIINGGDTFVSEMIKRSVPVKKLIFGINQECFFTKIHFKSGAFGMQKPDVVSYYKKYFSMCKKKKLAVYITEYVGPKNKKAAADSKKYCSKNGFIYYASHSLSLDRE